MHLGRNIGYSTIHPLYVKILVDKLKEYGAKIVYITDQTVQAKSEAIPKTLGVPVVPSVVLQTNIIMKSQLISEPLKMWI